MYSFHVVVWTYRARVTRARFFAGVFKRVSAKIVVVMVKLVLVAAVKRPLLCTCKSWSRMAVVIRVNIWVLGFQLLMKVTLISLSTT